MVKLTDKYIIVSKSDSPYLALSSDLSFKTKERQVRAKWGPYTIPAKTLRVYSYGEEDELRIPVGLLPLLSEYFPLGVKAEDERTKKNSKIYESNALDNVIFNILDFENILPEIILRKDQLIACRKILHFKKCIIQCATGFGKTEVMCAVSKLLKIVNEEYPTILILEPTVKLVNDTLKRFQSYGIEATVYSKNRKIIPNLVNIAHPMSICNDLDKDLDHLEDVEVLFVDECHHVQSDTYSRVVNSIPNAIYKIGVSASAVLQKHVNNTKITQYEYEELVRIGALGPVVMNVTAESLIGNDFLATPILLRINNNADEPLKPGSDVTDWHEISKKRLCSEKRNGLICESAKKFAIRNRKTLILVNTIKWSRELLKMFDEMGISDKVFASYGGGRFETYSDKEFHSAPSDCFEKFDSGEFLIAIGTTHLFEGADIKNLDVLVLGFGGKSERLQIQGLGRALRKSKTGKYAYIVDFTDSKDVVLSNQSYKRIRRYQDIIGITSDRIYNEIDVSEIDKIFDENEK